MRNIVRASFLIIGLLINSCSRHVGVYGDGEVIPIDFVYERFCYDFGKQTFNSSIVDKSDKITSYLKEHPKAYVIAMETLLNNNILLTRLGYMEVLNDPREGTF